MLGIGKEGGSQRPGRKGGLPALERLDDSAQTQTRSHGRRGPHAIELKKTRSSPSLNVRSLNLPELRMKKSAERSRTMMMTITTTTKEEEEEEAAAKSPRFKITSGQLSPRFKITSSVETPAAVGRGAESPHTPSPAGSPSETGSPSTSESISFIQA